ncbi:MAG TPA: LacI family DNA-binding transcriptional regulator [Candidatus Dormibacteraeota bacterium]|nr:LacI family DNA-binding transcriptional regulator [Candidatus Dormibacteraeota bacterium]
MPTIYDVAKISGYSITTVSKVLNNYPNVSNKAKQKVKMAVEELGYIPDTSARTLASKKSNMIGVVFPEALDTGLAHPFFSEVIEAFKKHVELYYYDLLFVSRNIGPNQNYHDHLKHHGVDGVVVINSRSDDEEIKTFNESDLPAVFIDIHIENANVVYSDNPLGCDLAVDYLHSLGHRKIANIAGASESFTGAERIQGFKKAIQKYGLSIPNDYIVDGGYFSYESGRTAMLKLLALPDRPTAVFVAGDEMAIGAIKVAKEMGVRIPEDISIIGFDDISLAKHIEPPLTTIRQDKDRIGRQAATLLLNEINGLSNEQHASIIPVRIEKRNSCSSLKG